LPGKQTDFQNLINLVKLEVEDRPIDPNFDGYQFKNIYEIIILSFESIFNKQRCKLVFLFVYLLI